MNCARCGRALLGVVYGPEAHGVPGRYLCPECYSQFEKAGRWGRVWRRLLMLRRWR